MLSQMSVLIYIIKSACTKTFANGMQSYPAETPLGERLYDLEHPHVLGFFQLECSRIRLKLNLANDCTTWSFRRM